VRWSKGAAATLFGPMAFFIEFLNLTRLYGRWEDIDVNAQMPRLQPFSSI
jgi:hypothetical protein